MHNCFNNPGMNFLSSTPYVVLPLNQAHSIYRDVGRNNTDYLILDHTSGELVYNVAMVVAHNMLTNTDSDDSTVINLSSDYMGGTQITMNGGSLTVINAMRWDGKSFQHEKGFLRIYNRFEHGYSSGLNGDAVEESYVAGK